MSMKWIPTILVLGLAITLPGHASAQDDPLGFFITSVGPGNGVKSRVVCKSERKLLDASVRLPWRPPSVREA